MWLEINILQLQAQQYCEISCNAYWALISQQYPSTLYKSMTMHRYTLLMIDTWNPGKAFSKEEEMKEEAMATPITLFILSVSICTTI